jgi:hypothetical protein
MQGGADERLCRPCRGLGLFGGSEYPQVLPDDERLPASRWGTEQSFGAAPTATATKKTADQIGGYFANTAVRAGDDR